MPITISLDEEGPIDNPNIDAVARAGALMAGGFADADDGLFAEDFVFHYYNTQLPHLTGDYVGLEGMKSFFATLHSNTEGTFRLNPISMTLFGDELIGAYATHSLAFGGMPIEVDALVVWRVVDGVILEAFDIPAVNTTRVAVGSES